jgi:hypothetical protein
MSLHEVYVIDKCITLRFQCMIFGAVLLCGCIKVCSSSIPPILRDLNVLHVRVGAAYRKTCTKCCCSQTGYFLCLGCIQWGVMEHYAAYLNFTEYEAHNFGNNVFAPSLLYFFHSFIYSFFLSFTCTFILWHK